MRSKLFKYLNTTVLISVGIFNYLPNAHADVIDDCNEVSSATSGIASSLGGFNNLSSICDDLVAEQLKLEVLESILGVNVDEATNTNSTNITNGSTSPYASLTTSHSVHFGSSTSAPIPVTIKFSVAVSGFSESDLSITNGTVSQFTAIDAQTYKLLITPINKEDIHLEVKAGSAINSSGVSNDRASTLKIHYFANQSATKQNADDPKAEPTATLKLPLYHDGAAPFTANIEFSKHVEGFSVRDIEVINGTITGFVAISTSHYVANITPSGEQDIHIQIAADAAQDQHGNSTKAINNTLGFRKIIEETTQATNRFMHTRAKSILRHQPRLTSLLSRTTPGANGGYGDLALNGNGANHQLSFFTSHSRINNTVQAMSAVRGNPTGVISSSNVDHKNITHSTNPSGVRPGSLRGAIDHNAQSINTTGVVYDREPYADNYNNQSTDVVYGDNDPTGTWDLWTKFESSKSTHDEDESLSGAGFLGFHYYLNDRTILGVMGQFDWVDQDNNNDSEVSGKGWMVGPYIAGQFQDHNLFYDARLTYGQASNEVSIIPGLKGEFDSTRLLMSGSLSGEYTFSEYQIQPGISATYYEETQESYQDSESNFIPEQTVSLGELRFGPSFSRSYDDGHGNFVTPSFGFSGIYTFASSDDYIAGQTVEADDDLRLVLDGGLNIASANGQQFSLTGFYDGIGDEGYESYGGSIGYSIPLQ